MDMGLTDRVALVTGAGGGIGAGIAREMAAEGARVVVIDRDGERAHAVAQSIGDRAIAVETDVADRGAVRAMTSEVLARFGRLDILVNNVGVTLADWIEDVTDDHIATTFDVNMRSHLLCTQAVIEPMKASRWGRLIYVSSASGIKASAGLALYSASKHWLRGLGVALGLELGKYNITANIVCPSDVYPEGHLPARTWTDAKLQSISMSKAGVDSMDALKQKRIEANPMGRACTVQDVADVVVFLASERAGFINAHTISVTGGALPV
jgi:NAD(P)-dependent dehydrogenase (short-subunit alcohol dehydrogenase family)